MRVIAAELGTWRTGQSRCRAEAVEEGAGEIQVSRIPIPRDVSRRKARRSYARGVLAACQHSETRPDLLLSLTRLPASVLMRLRRMGVPVIYVKTMFDDSSQAAWRRWKKWVLAAVHNRLVDCVVASSDVMRDNLSLGGSGTRLEVVPHGVDLDRFRPVLEPTERTRVRERLGLGAEDEVVLYVGPIIERKGLDYLVAAWDRVARKRPRSRLLLVGPERSTGSSDGSFGDVLRTALARGQGADRVSFVGSVPNVEEYLKAADVFAFPSWKEGMPNVVCEAFSAGVACVLTPFMGLPGEFGRPGVQYLLVEHDVTALSKAIASLLEDADRRQALGREARAWTKEHLSLEATLDHLARISRELVEETVS